VWRVDNRDITVGTTILDDVKAVVDLSTTAVFAENLDADFVKNGGFGNYGFTGKLPRTWFK
jgi:hypothetical protein